MRVPRLLAAAALALWAAAPASAQENLDQGKSAAQLFASDCAICHKSARGLSKGAGLFGLDNFLREHYTASRQSAAAISAYLQGIDREPAPRRERAPKRKAKASGPKLPPQKPSDGKTSDSKASDSKASDSKPSDSKPSDSKASDSKSDGKTAAPKGEAKAEKSDSKTGAKAEAAKPAASTPAKDSKPEKKPD